MTRKFEGWLVLAVLTLILAASVSHVARGFGAFESGTAGLVVGWGAALAIDAGIAVLMYRVVTGRPGHRWAVAGILLMGAVSIYANLDHALTVAAAESLAPRSLIDWHASAGWQIARVVILSATLPVLTIILAAVAHSGAKGVAATPAPVVITAKVQGRDGESDQWRDVRATFATATVMSPPPLPPAVVALLASDPRATLEAVGAAIGRHRSRAAAMMRGAGWVRGEDRTWRQGVVS